MKEKIYYLWSEDVCILNNLIYQSDSWTKEDKDRIFEMFSNIYTDLFNSPKPTVILKSKDDEPKK